MVPLRILGFPFFPALVLTLLAAARPATSAVSNSSAECDPSSVIDKLAAGFPKEIGTHNEPWEARPASKLALIGLIDRGYWQVALEDLSCGEIALVREGEAAFGCKVRKIIEPRTVLLECAGKEVELRMGEGRPAADSVVVAGKELVTAPPWIQELRQNLPSLATEDQQGARDQIREYWRQQWEGGLAEQVSKLKPDERTRIRAEIGRFWQK